MINGERGNATSVENPSLTVIWDLCKNKGGDNKSDMERINFLVQGFCFRTKHRRPACVQTNFTEFHSGICLLQRGHRGIWGVKGRDPAIPCSWELFPKHFSQTRIFFFCTLASPSYNWDVQQGRAREWIGMGVQEKHPQWVFSPQSHEFPSGKAPLPSHGWRNGIMEWKTWLKWGEHSLGGSMGKD